MGYPLKSSVLENALMSAGITLHTHLIQRPGKIFFDAHLWPPNPNIPYERLYIRASAVPTEKGQTARDYLETVVIPDLISWINNLLAQPPNSTQRRERGDYFRRDLPD